MGRPLTFLLLTISSAIPLTPHELEARENDQNGTVVMCSEYNWKGECVAMTVPLEYNSCTSLKDPWYQILLCSSSQVLHYHTHFRLLSQSLSRICPRPIYANSTQGIQRLLSRARTRHSVLVA